MPEAEPLETVAPTERVRARQWRHDKNETTVIQVLLPSLERDGGL